MIRRLGLLLVGLAAISPAAATRRPDVSFGGTFGVLGMGPQLSARSTHFGVHVDGAFGTFNGHLPSRSARYASRLSTTSAGMMLDLFPFGGQFHISAGARYAISSGTVRAVPGQAAMVAVQRSPISGTTDSARLTPAVSVGFGNSRPESALSWRVEGGLMARGGLKLSRLLAGDAAIPQERLALERADLQARLGRYFLFPTAQFEMAWKF